MKLFKFYFGLNLSQSLYAITGNISKTLQQKKISTLRTKELAELAVQALENIRNEHVFGMLYKKGTAPASEIETISPQHFQESE